VVSIGMAVNLSFTSNEEDFSIKTSVHQHAAVSAILAKVSCATPCVATGFVSWYYFYQPLNRLLK